MTHKPKLGIQGPVVAWQDPWAGEASDLVMRTGTGSVCPSQDPKPDAGAFVTGMQELGADFYVHHVLPGADLAEVVRDVTAAGMDICLGNEYGNINGPWVEGTNRYDIADKDVIQAAASGRCIGLLYDEPEHLQINAGQYRKDGWYPHWADTDGLDAANSRSKVEQAVRTQAEHVQQLAERAGGTGTSVPLISEQVFPTMFHTHARAGMDVCPKIMKESFQSLQLSTALGAAKQYGRALWICADLWGPDTGPWFTRFPGFPGHSPQEFESALKLGYFMGPSHLFVENIDVLLEHGPKGFAKTEFGEVWQQFVRKFIPEHRLTWSHAEAAPHIAVIHSDDANYGQNERLFGNRLRNAQDIERSQSVFHIWHLLSRGTIPAHGSCMHIPGYDFPRHQLKREVPLDRFPLKQGFTGAEGRRVHPLFYPVNNVLAFDEHVTAEQLGQPKLIVVGGSTLSPAAFANIVKKAEEGAVVVIADWLLPADGPERFKESGKAGFGKWIVTGDFLGSEAREAVEPFLGEKRVWTQRFGSTEVRMYPQDEEGFALDFDIVQE
ncbi:hypothetical protein [Bacillus sp. 3255]|uniref:hypothetical protein n=1 Tax=Bacillus sp. 3255 TaxID=2817904 RepID=UPI00285D4795|nr:hypothetical protein [Bacillus sp. 3255]MDR6880606.1 hypothetical protein [Bacillus sp. 3255]